MNSEDSFIKRTYNRFLIPTVFALLGTTVSSFGNTILAGHFLGKEVLGVMNVLSSFTFLFAMFGCLISIGASTKASIAVGRIDHETAGKYEWMALVLSIAVPLVISIPCIINFRHFFSLLGGAEKDYVIGASYGIPVLAFGFLNTLMYFPFNFLRMIGKGKYGMFSFGAMGVLDIVLVYVFLKLNMGAAGVAYGNIISMVVANASGIYFLVSKNSLFKMKRHDKKEIGSMLQAVDGLEPIFQRQTLVGHMTVVACGPSVVR